LETGDLRRLTNSLTKEKENPANAENLKLKKKQFLSQSVKHEDSNKKKTVIVEQTSTKIV